MLKNILMVLFIMLVAAGSSFAAGSLFPPENRGNGQACGEGYALSWTGGSLECVGVSSKNKCTGNEVMVSLTNGDAICTDISGLVKTIVNSCRGQTVYYGIIQDVNAGVLTLNPGHLNGGTQKVGSLFGC